LLWIISSLFYDYNHKLLPNPIGVWTIIREEFISADLFKHLLITMCKVAFALLASTLMGVSIGCVMSKINYLKTCLVPIFDFIRSIPTPLLYPLVIVIFGIGSTVQYVLAIYASLPIIALSTIVGLSPTEESRTKREYLELHKRAISSFNWYASILWIALPSIVIGLRAAIASCLVIVVVSEMFLISKSGIGWYSYQAYLRFDINRLYLSIFSIGIIGYSINSCLDRFYNYLRKH